MSVRRQRLIYPIILGLICFICMVYLRYISPKNMDLKFNYYYPMEDPVWSIMLKSQQKRNIKNDALEILISKSHFDVSGKFKIIPYVYTAKNWTQLSKNPLCTAVQCSLDRADLLPKFMDSWTGPLSVAIFAPAEEFSLTMKYIKYLINCYPSIRDQVSFHLIFPVNLSPEESKNISIHNIMLESCDKNSSAILQNLLNMRSNSTLVWRNELQYPQNILRNVAREHCQTPWVTCIDVDMLFPELSKNVYPSILDNLNKFLLSSEAETCEKCAFVIPIFELDYSALTIPTDKLKLKSLVQDKKARQYHLEVFSSNQGLTRINSKWLKLPASQEVKIAYKTEKFKFWYEPVYISRRGTPRFDERYVGFGMVRNTQAYEMFLAGYTFHVLDNVFLSHWGYQHRNQVISKQRKKQTDNNYHRFVFTHVRELAAKYDMDPLGLLKNSAKKKDYNINITVANKTTKSKV